MSAALRSALSVLTYKPGRAAGMGRMKKREPRSSPGRKISTPSDLPNNARWRGLVDRTELFDRGSPGSAQRTPPDPDASQSPSWESWTPDLRRKDVSRHSCKLGYVAGAELQAIFQKIITMKGFRFPFIIGQPALH